MNVSLHIELGFRPWVPNEKSELDEVLNAWDKPLSGVLSVAGQQFAFHCLVGEVEPLGLWGYISTEDVHDPTDLQSARWILSLREGEMIQLAATWEDEIIATGYAYRSGNQTHLLGVSLESTRDIEAASAFWRAWSDVTARLETAAQPS